jgi:predicted metal-dependent HD superfamily phosphohydrolase
MTHQEQGEVTGTRDRHYDIMWFTQACLDNVLRLQTYAQDAERDGDQELAEFFRKAQADSQKGADQGKDLLRARLGQ